MSNVTLEERMTKLEQIVDKFMHKSDVSTPKKDWRRTVGMFDGDPIMKGTNILDSVRNKKDSEAY